MFIKSRKRSKPNTNSHPGPALDYLGEMPSPTSPHEDPYWTLRITKKQGELESDDKQSNGEKR